MTANGLSSRCLRAAQRRGRRLAHRVRGQVVAAEALDGQHAAAGEHFGGAV